MNLSQSAVNAADNEAVALPMASLPVTDSQAMAPVVTVDLPTGTAAAKVEVPVQKSLRFCGDPGEGRWLSGDR